MVKVGNNTNYTFRKEVTADMNVTVYYGVTYTYKGFTFGPIILYGNVFEAETRTKLSYHIRKELEWYEMNRSQLDKIRFKTIWQAWQYPEKVDAKAKSFQVEDRHFVLAFHPISKEEYNMHKSMLKLN